eukprot:1404121-Amphidinium_carterae.1
MPDHSSLAAWDLQPMPHLRQRSIQGLLTLKQGRHHAVATARLPQASGTNRNVSGHRSKPLGQAAPLIACHGVKNLSSHEPP